MPDHAVAIVTGAGGGIGRAICLQLSEFGFRIALVGRTRRSLEETAAAIKATPITGADPLVLPADLAQADHCRSVIRDVLDHWSRVDVLVNNAALGKSAPLELDPDDLAGRTFAINFLGPLRLISHLWPHWVSENGGGTKGRVVNISSLATVDPFPGLSIYAASKCALDSITRSVVNEGSGAGMAAWSIAPGAVETAMLRSFMSTADLPQDKTLAPEQVARVVVECATGKRDHEIGQIILLPSPE